MQAPSLSHKHDKKTKGVVEPQDDGKSVLDLEEIQHRDDTLKAAVEYIRKAEEKKGELGDISAEITPMAKLVRSLSVKVGKNKDNRSPVNRADVSVESGSSPRESVTPKRDGARRVSSPAMRRGHLFGSRRNVEQGPEAEEKEERAAHEQFVRRCSTVSVEADPLALRQARALQDMLRARVSVPDGRHGWSSRDFSDCEV